MSLHCFFIPVQAPELAKIDVDFERLSHRG